MANLGYLLIGGVLWNNVIITHLLGLFPFLGEQPDSVKENGVLGLVTTTVMVLSVAAGLVVRTVLLGPLELLYLEHLVMILLVLAILGGVARWSDAVSKGSGRPAWLPGHLLLRVFLNSATFGVVVLKLESGSAPMEALVTTVGLGLGVTFLLVLVRAIDDRPETRLVPEWLRGMPLQFMTLGMVALALNGFSGI